MLADSNISFLKITKKNALPSLPLLPFKFPPNCVTDNLERRADSDNGLTNVTLWEVTEGDTCYIVGGDGR